ncbi:MAG: carbon-nitrogen hydrolase family protein [Anaerolineales bacterium]|nr:carbon-nitrogen hydrolase family protein [Anaerolineales bacterium]
MQEFHVACAQFNAEPAATVKNVQRMIELAAEAKSQGCELVNFAETIVTGYLPVKEMAGLAEPLNGHSITTLAEAAVKLEIALSFGFVERGQAGEKPFNSMIVLDCRGSILSVFRKMHLWKAEKEWAQPGDSVPVFTIHDTRFSGLICYDFRFPEAARLGALEGAEVMLGGAAWLGPGDEWELAVRARALDNSVFIAAADSINRVAGLECYGRSIIVGPRGNVLARSEEGSEGIITATLDPGELAYQRNRVPLMWDRMPENYSEICK